MQEISYFFTEDNYPCSQQESEKIAFDRGYDTIAVITDGTYRKKQNRYTMRE